MNKENISLKNLVVERVMSHEDAMKLAREQTESGQYRESDNPIANMTLEEEIKYYVKNGFVPQGPPGLLKKYYDIKHEMKLNGEI